MMLRYSGLTALALALAITPLRGQQHDAAVVAAVERHLPAAVRYRQQIHQFPELSNREVKTAELVAAHLRELGLEVRTGVAKTGVVGVLRGARPGPVVAVRADMDALPVTEETDLPFKSTERATYLNRDVGVSHACGHDLHVAIGLGTASVLAGMRERLAGTVVFLFQPAEEGPPPGEEGGAGLMVREGALDNPRPDAVLGLHINGDPPDEAGDHEQLGRVAYTVGPAMAAATSWDAVVVGRQAHGASPHLSVDPVVTASEIVLALQTIRSRNLEPLSQNVITVGVVRGGERHNIIPAQVELRGTIRTFNPGTQDTVERRMREIFEGVTRAHNASFTLEFNRSHPVTVNDTALTRRLVPTLERIAGRERVAEVPPQTGAEDFSFFAQQVPGFYFYLGAVPAGRASGGHHTPTFYADDGAVPIGMRLMTGLVVDFLEGRGRRVRR